MIPESAGLGIAPALVRLGVDGCLADVRTAKLRSDPVSAVTWRSQVEHGRAGDGYRSERMRDQPVVTERINDASLTQPIRLISDGEHLTSPCAHRVGLCGISVVDVQ
jgi:hypothetical protein